MDDECKWVDVNLKEANQLNAGDLKNRNYRIVSYVMDLPAFRFFQYQVFNLNHYKAGL